MKKKYYYTAVYYNSMRSGNVYVDGEIELDPELPSIDQVCQIKIKVYHEFKDYGCESHHSVKVINILK